MDIFKNIFKFILGVLLGLGILFGVTFLVILPQAIEDFPGFFLVLLSLSIILPILLYSLPSLITYIIDTSIEKLDAKLHDIQFESQNYQSFEEILSLTKKGYSTFRMAKLLWIYRFMSQSDWLKQKIVLYYSYVEGTLLGTLRNIRSQLHDKLDDQKNLLKEERSKVIGIASSHTDEIVTSRFKMVEKRLDRQIEQFEELQRVLVKV